MGLARLPAIERLHLADVTLPPAHPLGGGRCPVFGYMIMHPDGPIVVDTGVGEHAGIDRLYQPVRRSLSAALAAAGTSIREVVAVVNTHLHFDHCGGNSAFAGVRTIVQRAGYEAAQEPLYAVPEWVDFPDATYELVSGEAEVVSGVTVMPTPGHTPGHQSVVIESAEGRAVVAGQAAYTADEFARPGAADARAQWSAEQYTASLDRLRDLRPARVYFAHDEAVWAPGELRKETAVDG